MPKTPEEAARALDDELADVAKEVSVLLPLRWPRAAEEAFLRAWRAGAPELPAVELGRPDHGGVVEALASIRARCDRAHPIGNLVYKHARSYATAVEMLAAIGTPDFTRHSVALYGRPDDRYRTQSVNALDAARYFLDTTDDLLGGFVVPPTVADIPAGEFAVRLQQAIDRHFPSGVITVTVDDDLSSKALARSDRVRLRDGALFSELDLEQLLQHEALVHSATMLNGKAQPNLHSLGLGAPRTTRTQEGLACLAELLTLSLDIARLRRIALRVCAIHAALDGADFIEVFRLFLEAGQSEEESYQSAVRVFRGGDVRGGVAFTKDGVYIKGLLEVHAFLRVAIHDNRPELVQALFAGRLTLGDAVELAPLLAAGLLAPPRYVPPWARDLRVLASALAYSTFASRIDLSAVRLENFVRLEEEAAGGSE